MVQIQHVDCMDADMVVHMMTWPTDSLMHGSDMAYGVDYAG
jgi:hypothetical protein